MYLLNLLISPAIRINPRCKLQMSLFLSLKAKHPVRRLKRAIAKSDQTIFTPLTSPPGQKTPMPKHLARSAESMLKSKLMKLYLGLYGPIEAEQAYFIQTRLAPFLKGKDPLATERLSDEMLRIDRHGRSGMFVTAISVVDCALWDLRGKALAQPVYRLLGGPTRKTIPVYASMLGFPSDPENAGRIAAEYKAKGFIAQKWFFRFGPSHGEAGKRRNIEMAQAVRAAVGTDYLLMFDAFMGWDVSYAIAMGKALAEINPHWLEEPIHPERVGGFQRIKQETGIPIATGEHVYTRWQVKELLSANAIDVLQVDPDWDGGITEHVKICALASAFNVPTIAHGHSLLPPLHIAASQSPTVVPLVEYLIYHQPNKQFFHHPIYEPENGSITVPDAPGLGLILDKQYERLPFTQ